MGRKFVEKEPTIICHDNNLESPGQTGLARANMKGKKYMDITDWLDIENKEHMEAYSQLQQISEWQPIETAPDDDTQIDIWSTTKGRLTDYHLVIRSEDNIFYEPGKHGGYTCIRDATHWMPIPKDPVIKKEVKNKK